MNKPTIEELDRILNDPSQPDVMVMPDGSCVSVASNPYEGPKSHEEARAIHDGFNAGLTAYACAIGHSGLRSNNQTLRELMDKHGFETIEIFEKLQANRPSAVAIEVAARLWCDPEMSNVVMDVDAAEEIARIIDRVREESDYEDQQSALGKYAPFNLNG